MVASLDVCIITNPKPDDRGQTSGEVEVRVLDFLAYCEELRANANRMKLQNYALMVRAHKIRKLQW